MNGKTGWIDTTGGFVTGTGNGAGTIGAVVAGSKEKI